MQQAYVLGVGNTICGDDGIGPRMLDYLAARQLDQNFHMIDVGGGGLKILHYLDASVDKILLVDSAFMGMSPGDCRVFEPDNAATKKEESGLSTHGGDVLKILQLAKSLELFIPPIRILGIEPASVSHSLELSDDLKNRMPEYARIIIEEINNDWR